METADTRIIGSYLLEAEPCVVEDERVCAERAAIRPQDGDGVRNGVDGSPALFVCDGKFTGPLRQVGLRVLELGVEMRVLQGDGGLRRQ